MQVWSLSAFGLDNLERVERDRPTPGRGQVLLRMKAMSLNFRDLLMVQGLYNPRQPLPLVPCSDGVGEIVALGEGAGRFPLGARVCPIFTTTWLGGRATRDMRHGTLGGPLDGTLCEYMVLDEQALVAVPEHLSDAAAASLPCAAVTAWRAVAVEGGIRAGDTVLTLGTGGVSLFALQLAKAMGARVVVTSSSDEKLERARALGADLCVNYRTDPDWGRTVARATGGVELVVELGGAATFAQSMRAVGVGGTIAQIGNLGGNSTEVNLTWLLMHGIRVQGVFVGHRQDFEDLVRCLAAHPDLDPVIDTVHDFAEADGAFKAMIKGGHFGKIVVAL